MRRLSRRQQHNLVNKINEMNGSKPKPNRISFNRRISKVNERTKKFDELIYDIHNNYNKYKAHDSLRSKMFRLMFNSSFSHNKRNMKNLIIRLNKDNNYNIHK